MAKELTDEELLATREAGAAWCSEELFGRVFATIDADRERAAIAIENGVTVMRHSREMGWAWQKADQRIRDLLWLVGILRDHMRGHHRQRTLNEVLLLTEADAPDGLCQEGHHDYSGHANPETECVRHRPKADAPKEGE